MVKNHFAMSTDGIILLIAALILFFFSFYKCIYYNCGKTDFSQQNKKKYARLFGRYLIVVLGTVVPTVVWLWRIAQTSALAIGIIVVLLVSLGIGVLARDNYAIDTGKDLAAL